MLYIMSIMYFEIQNSDFARSIEMFQFGIFFINFQIRTSD